MTHADTLEYPDRIQSKFYIGKSIPLKLLKIGYARARKVA